MTEDERLFAICLRSERRRAWRDKWLSPMVIYFVLGWACGMIFSLR